MGLEEIRKLKEQAGQPKEKKNLSDSAGVKKNGLKKIAAEKVSKG